MLLVSAGGTLLGAGDLEQNAFGEVGPTNCTESGSPRENNPAIMANAGWPARRVDNTAQQPGFPRLRRFPARGVGPGRPRTGGLCRDFFRRAVALELSFFEAANAD